MICSALCQCSPGAWGTLSYHTRVKDGLRVTAIRSTGIEISNLPYRRGITLGARKTVVAQRIPGTPSTDPAARRFGRVPEFPGEILHVSTASKGLELSADQTFVGLGLGINSRVTTALPVNGSETFHVVSHPDKPERFSIRHDSP